jgi:hypothetical protein
VISISRGIGQIKELTNLWGENDALLSGNEIIVTVNDRDAAVIRLQ